MAGDSAKVGRWREGGASRGPVRTGPSSSTKWIGTSIVGALLAVAVAAAGWIGYQLPFRTGPTPYFVGLWVGPYDRPEIPPIAWQDADRRALVADEVFTHVDARPEAAPKPTLEVLQRRLKGLATRPPGEDVVVYLSAYAVVDAEGKVRILAADSVPYEAKTQLALSEVVKGLKDCPSGNKLLVLDIMRGMVDPRDVGGTADDVAELVPRELGDSDATVIVACGPGQVAAGSEMLRHSAFGYYFHRALTTKEADADSNGTVSVVELADYLGRRVDAWSVHFRGRHQTPARLGRKPGDFAIARSREPAPVVAAAEKAIDKVAGAAKGVGAAKGAEADEAKTKEATGDAKEEDKGASKEAPAVAGQGEPSGGYPAGLASAWEAVERWRADGDAEPPAAAAPRVYRRLAREAIRAELRWRGGEPIEAVEADLKKTADELIAAMDQAGKIPRPGVVRSVGQARAFGIKPDPALKAALGHVIGLRRDLPDDSPRLAEEVKKGLEAFKGKGGLELAQALAEAASEVSFDPKSLAFLGGLVEKAGDVLDPDRPPRGIIELRFLRQLAERARAAGAAGGWKPETARLAWRTVLDAEEAHSRPDSFARVRDRLGDADASLHEARVLLLPQAAGYASWSRIAAAWGDASRRYQNIRQRQRAIRDGRAALARTMDALAGLVPYLDAMPDAELQEAWLEAVRQGQALAPKLAPPGGRQPERPGADVDLADAAGQLNRLWHTRLMAPFQASAVRAIVERCKTESPPDPTLVDRIDALLLTPFPAPADRRALLEGVRVLEGRLGKSWQEGGSAESSANAAGDGGRAVERLRRRFERVAGLLELTGDPATMGRLGEDRAAVGGPDLAVACPAMARCAARTYEAFGRLLRAERPGDELDRPGWLAPAYLAESGEWATRPGPTRQIREKAARAAWAWLAAHYRFESRDLHEDMDPDDVLAAAANECPADVSAGAEVALRIDGPASPVELSPTKNQAAVVLRLRLTGADAPQKVTVGVLEPEDRRVLVAAPEIKAPEIAPDPTPVSIGLRLADDPGGAVGPPPPGFVATARTQGGRTYHALVPLSVVTAGTVPRLALSRSKADCDDTPMDRLRLRPIQGLRQPYYVFVKNPSQRTWGVIVDILEGDDVLATSGPKPLEVAAGTSKPVPGFGVTAPKVPEPLREARQPLSLRLKDGAGVELDRQPLRATIADPADYLEVKPAQFVPAAQGQPNRLIVAIRPLPALTDPPCRVELSLPREEDLFPALRDDPKAGNLAGDLKPGNQPLTLYAEDLGLTPLANPEGSFCLNVDGVRGALWFRARFPQVGGPQEAREYRPRRVRFTARPLLDPAQPGQVGLEVASRVDGVSPEARIAFHLGRVVGGQFREDLAWDPVPAKARHLGFDPGGEGGALLFEASIEDRRWTRKVGVIGRCRLFAVLTDGKEKVESPPVDVVLDNRRPERTSLEVPDRVAAGTKEIKVRATAVPPPAGIKEVAIIVGRAADFDKAVAANQVVLARPGDPDGRDWSASLPIPADAAGKVVVTARFTTGVGLTAFQSEEVAIEQPRPMADAKAAAEKPGSIAGTVTEGDRPQPGLLVQLWDPNPPPNAPRRPLHVSKTDEKGTYAFTDLKPKPYQVYCMKQDGINNRSANKLVTVEPGQDVKLDLELTK